MTETSLKGGADSRNMIGDVQCIEVAPEQYWTELVVVDYARKKVCNTKVCMIGGAAAQKD